MKPKEADVCDHHSGWLSPAGEFYGCDIAQHSFWAALLVAEELYCVNSELYLEKQNWRKLQEDRWLHGDSQEVTQAQFDVMLRHATSRNQKLPPWVRVEGTEPLPILQRFESL